MSYSISISGHKDTSGRDESEAFENEVAQKARELVASLEGVSSATGSFGAIGQQDLKAAS
jgi:hypothetical protein